VIRKVKTRVDSAKLRQDPQPQGQVLLELPAGTELELLDYQQRYSRVKVVDDYRTVEGWMANVALGLADDPPDQAMPISTDSSCPICQGDAWRGLPIVTSAHHGFKAYLGGFFRPYELEARVCLKCGYVLGCFVSEKSLRRLRQERE
jgi:hypothetical protein